MNRPSIHTAVLSVFDQLRDASPRRVVAIGAALIAIVTLLDLLSGYETRYSVFYVFPIILLTWYHSQRAGIIASMICAVLWMVVNLLSGETYTSQLLPIWNIGVRLAFFLIVTLVMAPLRAARDDQEEMTQFLVHDLRSPLGNMLIGLEMLETDAFNSSPEMVREIAQTSVISGNRMMILINSLLDVGSLERGKLSMNTAPVAVRELLNKAARQVSALGKQQSVDVGIKVTTGAETILADPDLTLRILVNLLSNAIRYSPEGSTVDLRAESDTDGAVRIVVADQGPGIPKEWLNKLFHRYTQVASRKAGVAVGTGLGLSFCRLAVEAQDGHIWVESELGEGTQFIFTLPRAA